MALPQQKFREIVLQMLYSKDIGQASDEHMIPLLMKELSVTKSAVRNAQKRVYDILNLLTKIDNLIAETVTSYKFERIQTIERNVLRLGIYELLFDDAIPPKVAIAEAIRLSRKFSTPESATFINAAMDALFKSHCGEK